MFKKTQRLNRKDFNKLFKNGKRVNGDNVSVIYLESNKTKVAVVVGKKVAKKATERNLLRRRVYFVLKNNLNLIKNKQLIVFIKINISYSILKNNIENKW